jgi:hypothetical protein
MEFPGPRNPGRDKLVEIPIDEIGLGSPRRTGAAPSATMPATDYAGNMLLTRKEFSLVFLRGPEP